MESKPDTQPPKEKEGANDGEQMVQEEKKDEDQMKKEQEDNDYLKPNWDESVDRFDDMGLKEEVLRGIYGYGFNKPSPIQMKGILPIIQGNDTIAQAQSGTGKTGAFTIATLQTIDAASNHTQALIVSPVRELAL